MNGPEHYAEAERLIESATFDHNAGPGAGNAREADVALALAQVHATLALAAATVGARATHSPERPRSETYCIETGWEVAL